MVRTTFEITFYIGVVFMIKIACLIMTIPLEPEYNIGVLYGK